MPRPGPSEVLLNAFEAAGGHLPEVTAAADLYADYREWAEEAQAPVPSFDAFVHSLLRRRFLPCRLSDGTLAFIGIGLNRAWHARMS